MDLGREELKDNIDWYSNELFQSISDTQLTYVQLSKEMTLKLAQSKQDLNGYICSQSQAIRGHQVQSRWVDSFKKIITDANKDCYSSFGYSYKHPDYLCASDRAHCILAG